MRGPCSIAGPRRSSRNGASRARAGARTAARRTGGSSSPGPDRGQLSLRRAAAGYGCIHRAAGMATTRSRRSHRLHITTGEKLHRVHLGEGTLEEIVACDASPTGQYLDGHLEIAIPATRRMSNGKHLSIRRARENNLKNIDVEIPLGLLVCVTGVSGSGKSSLINEVLYKTLRSELQDRSTRPGDADGVEGIEHAFAGPIDADATPRQQTDQRRRHGGGRPHEGHRLDRNAGTGAAGLPRGARRFAPT